MYQVLVIEDDASIRGGVEAETAARAEIEARSHKPDLLLVDLGLPDGDGLKVIQRIRAWSPVPIVVLSARTMEAQKIAALDAGADDYVTKPFSAPELLARVQAARRRSARSSDQPPVLHLGEITVDRARRQTSSRQAELHLTPLEPNPSRPQFLVTEVRLGYRLKSG